MGHVSGKIMERYGQKLRRTILLHVGLITFRLAYGKDQKPRILMISGFSDVSLSSKTSIIHLWRPQDTSNKPRKLPSRFWKIFIQWSTFRKPNIWGMLEKTGADNPDDPSNIVWKSWIWDQDISKTWNCNLYSGTYLF